MQGHIYQINQRQRKDLDGPQSASFAADAKETYKSRVNPFVSIYNEDDLTHFLYQRTKPLDDAELHQSYGHAHNMGIIAAALDDYFPAAPHEYSDDSGIPTDDENEETMSPSTYAGTPYESSPSYVHHLELPPRFIDPSAEYAARDRAIDTSRMVNNQLHMNQAPAEIQHVSAIEGQLMSWWPLPLDQDEYIFDQPKQQERTTVAPVVSKSQHVSSIEGPCMSWWPMPMEAASYDWNERFYE